VKVVIIIQLKNLTLVLIEKMWVTIKKLSVTAAKAVKLSVQGIFERREMTKRIYIVAALVLTFAAADATTTRIPKAKIEVVYQPQANGDYRLYIFANDRQLVCEEKDLKIIKQGDAISPVVVECKH
jgi:hypothetical protein